MKVYPHDSPGGTFGQCPDKNLHIPNEITLLLIMHCGTRVFPGHRGQTLRGGCPLCPEIRSRVSVIVPCGLGGWTDGPSCCLLFSHSANESPDAAQSQSNESSRVWACFGSWVVQSARGQQSAQSECTGWMHVGDGNVTQLF